MTDLQYIPSTEKLQIAVKKLQLRFPVKEIAAATGFNKGSISSFLKGTIRPSVPFIEKFEEVFNIKIEDSQTNNKQFATQNIVSEHLEKYNNQDPEFFENKNGNKFIELKNGKFKIIVRKVPVRAFGSYLSDFQNVEFLEELEEVSFTVDHVGKGKYMCFEVEGDSMNGGGIDDTPDGAELLCRELGRHHWKDGFNHSKYGWVIVHKKTVLFKDIKSMDKETGDIICGSRSGLPNHPDFTINLNDVNQILKVIKRTF